MSQSCTLASCLKNYYENVVRSDTNGINEFKRKVVCNFIDDAAQYVSVEDARFDPNLIFIGSEWQGTEIEGYSDFDILFPLRVTAECRHWDKGLSRVDLYETPTGTTWSAYCGKISSKDVRNCLADMLEVVAVKWNEYYKRQLVEVCRQASIPVKIVIHLDSVQSIPIDITPCFYIHKVSGAGKKTLVSSSITRSRGCWPSFQEKQKLKQYIAFFPAGEKWRVSLPEGHKILIRDMDPEGEQTCRKKLFHILKALSYREWHEDKLKLPSYVLAVVLFREIEEYPDWRDWTESNLPDRFKGAIARLSSASRQGILYDFFLPGTDVLEPSKRHSGIEALQKYGGNVMELEKNPCIFLKGQCCPKIVEDEDLILPTADVCCSIM